MAKKNEKSIEEVLENDGMVVTTLGEVMAAVDEDADEKAEFINENISLVPNNRRHVFLTWDIDRQYKEITRWKEIKEWKDKVAEAQKIENKIKELFERRKVTLDEVMRVIDFCNEWIKSERENEITRIDEEIMRLEERRNALTSC